MLKTKKSFVNSSKSVLHYVFIFIMVYTLLTISYQYYDSKLYCLNYEKWQNNNFSSVYKYPYMLISKCENKCINQEEYDVIFLVKSYIANYEKRNAIRLTWGLEDPFPDCKVRRVFLMAVDHKNDSVRVETLKEQEFFGDIILADYHDAYFNNSIKCMMGINWARNFCPNSKFYVLADDDAYISTKNLMKYLKNETYDDEKKRYSSLFLDQQNSSSKLNFFGGDLFEYPPVMRDGDWAVSKKEFPFDNYPNFLNGHTMVMSRNVLDEFSSAAYFTKFFKIDDVYFGFLSSRAGISPQQIDGVTGRTLNVSDFNSFDKIISSHYISASELLMIHQEQKRRGNA